MNLFSCYFFINFVKNYIMKQTLSHLKYIYIVILILLFNLKVQSQAFSLDTTFNLNYNFYVPGSYPAIFGLNFEPDGKLMIYGDYNDIPFGGEPEYPINIIRVYENGIIDTSWHYLGAEGDYILFLERLNNDYIMLATYSLAKVNYNGFVTDTVWNNKLAKVNCYGSYYYPYIFPDGSMLVGSDPCITAKCLMKFMPDGTIDTNFRHTTNNVVFGITKYSSDKLLLYGGGTYGFTKYDTIPIIRMCRIDTLGNLDTTFKSIFTNGNPVPYYIQNDGKIIVVSGFNINNNNQIFSLIRLNPDGSLDSTFNNFNTVTYPDYVNCVCPTTDGGYLIGGGYSNYQGYSKNNIVKTDINGFIDTTYFSGEGIDSTFLNLTGDVPYVYSIKQGTNDTYYVMGYFTYYNGVHVNPIIRLKGISAGINEIKQEKGIVKVFPNPASSQLTIDLQKLDNLHNTTVSVYDIQGQLLLQQLINQEKTVLNITGFAKGVYIVKVFNDNNTMVSKFVKE